MLAADVIHGCVGVQSLRGLAASSEAAPSDVMYGSMMHAMARGDAKSRAEVLGMLAEARERGVQPNVIMYNEVGFSRAGKGNCRRLTHRLGLFQLGRPIELHLPPP